MATGVRNTKWSGTKSNTSNTMNPIFQKLIEDDKPRIAIGTQYHDRNGRLCTVTDILRTFDSKGVLVNVRYCAVHEFLGQLVESRDVLDVTIQRCLYDAQRRKS